MRKLGFLAGIFEDGSISVYAVPEPDALRTRMADGDRYAADEPILLRMRDPILKLEIEGTSVTSLDWGSSDLLVGGCSNGKSKRHEYCHTHQS